jgi:hypothetical protein
VSTRQSRAAANGQSDAAYLRARHRPRAQSARDAYQRGLDTKLLACSACGANYLDDPPARPAALS